MRFGVIKSPTRRLQIQINYLIRMSQTAECKAQEDSKPPESSETDSEPADKWMIRECDLYWDEYKECTSMKGRFHQYFIFGEMLDCNKWRKDYDNCTKWESRKDAKSAEALIESEKTRRLERLKAHYGNDIWKKRESPPSDWDKPLPEWIVKRDENTYLDLRAKEIKEGKTEEEQAGRSCSIM